MQSLLRQKDHNGLIKINRSLTPEQRLEAFYQHSQLLVELYLANPKNKKQDKNFFQK